MLTNSGLDYGVHFIVPPTKEETARRNKELDAIEKKKNAIEEAKWRTWTSAGGKFTTEPSLYV